ncbi:MAG TPA: phosphatase PAP2 family protein [Candidatus Dormibacteraeota bacterium]|nr:phosphatase PAP2 family protein [Candidatus Dormibacteraeota bacterium]
MTAGRLRAPLAAIGLVALAVFVLDTIEALRHPYLPFDVPLALLVQRVPWGPLLPAFALVDWFEGVRQVVATAAALLLVLALNRRAFPLVAVGALSGAAYSLTEALVARPRPPASLVHVIRHTAGYSYPSGHVVFFSWFVPLLVLALVRPYLPPVWSWLGWTLALLLVALAGVGRVYVGEHWPSDVLGGLALGVGWTALALSVRPLSDPVLEEERRPGARRRGPARLWG